MRKLDRVWVAVVVALAMAGCGDGHHDREEPLLVADILSDVSVDGDIDAGGIVTTASGTVLAGVSPSTGNEFRGFLSFPLASVPANARVQFASLEVFVIDLNPIQNTPVTIDLVSFQPPLISSDFSDTGLPFLLTRNFTFLPRDPGNFVEIDVTPMLQEAFRRGLADAQFRLLLDVNFNVGLLTIADPVAAATAPLLHIEYF